MQPMPESLSYLLVHIIFSTKKRAPLLEASVRPNLHAYLATVVRGLDCECFRVGGVSDHVHLAVRLSRTIAVSKVVEHLKTSSSKWLKTQHPRLHAFAGQRGYAAFSVGPSNTNALIQYIATQEQHHTTCTYQDEYRAFLRRYGISSIERHLWD
jgi:REP element-mobilizing transposase RayT